MLTLELLAYHSRNLLKSFDRIVKYFELFYESDTDLFNKSFFSWKCYGKHLCHYKDQYGLVDFYSGCFFIVERIYIYLKLVF